MEYLRSYQFKTVFSESDVLYERMHSEKVSKSIEAADLVRKFYKDDLLIYESFFILMVDNSNKPIGFAKISQGGISQASIDVRIVVKYCLETLCSGVLS